MERKVKFPSLNIAIGAGGTEEDVNLNVNRESSMPSEKNFQLVYLAFTQRKTYNPNTPLFNNCSVCCLYAEGTSSEML